MRDAFASFKEIIVIAGLAYLIASILAVATIPVDARGEQAVSVSVSVSVDRANKGDRLPYASRSKTHVNSPFLATTPQVLPKRPPLGCDPAFSSVANPAQARIYRRCLA